MLLRLSSNGYAYTDVDGTVFFKESNDHDSLFKFVAADFSSLPQMLECYFDKVIDLSTFKFKKYKLSYKDRSKMLDLLSESHPYFEYEDREFLIRSIGEYFNALLIQSSFNEEDYSFSPIYDRDWYFECLNALLADLLWTDEQYLQIFFNDYKAIVNEEKHLPHLPPQPFISLINIQNAAKTWLFWLLDAHAPHLNSLTIPQRVWLFGNIFNNVSDQPDISVTKQISFSNPHGRDLFSNYRRLEYIDGIDHHFTLFGDLQNYHLNQDNIHPKAQEALLRAIESAKRKEAAEIYEEYEIGDLYQLLFLEIYQMVLDNTLIKKCRHCGNYFVIENLNVEYCGRVMEGEKKKCSEIGPRRAYQRKLEEDYPLKIYNRSYKTHYARVKSGRITKAQFNNWYLEAKEKLEQARAGTLSVKDFEEWLKR